MQHRYGRWPTLEELGVVCMGKPLLGRIEKSFRARLPQRLQDAVARMIFYNDPAVNQFMPLLRVLETSKKHSIDLIINDIIIYLEAATLDFKASVLLTNDIFSINIGRYPEVLNFILRTVIATIDNFNDKSSVRVEYNFKKLPVLLISDVVYNFHGGGRIRRGRRICGILLYKFLFFFHAVSVMKPLKYGNTS